LLRLGELERARAGLTSVLEVNDGDAVALARLSLVAVELRSGRLEAARASFERIERPRVNALELELLEALLALRSDESAPSSDAVMAFMASLGEASEQDRAELERVCVSLGVSEREHELLGLDAPK
jgi:hypothetical protein